MIAASLAEKLTSVAFITYCIVSKEIIEYMKNLDYTVTSSRDYLKATSSIAVD